MEGIHFVKEKESGEVHILKEIRLITNDGFFTIETPFSSIKELCDEYKDVKVD